MFVARRSYSYLEKAFTELAVTMARSDPYGARRVLFALNADMARSLHEEDAKLIAAGEPFGGMREIALQLHATLKTAERAVQQASL